MAVDTTQILAVYDLMVAKHISVLDAQFDAERINSDLYAKALVSLLHQTMQLSTAITQQQPMTEAQIEKLIAETTLASQKIVGRKQ